MRGGQPAVHIVVKALEKIAGVAIAQHVGRIFLNVLPGGMVGHVGAHQVNEGEDGLIWRGARAIAQQTSGVFERFGSVAFEAEGGLPQGHHDRCERQSQ